MSNDEFLRQFEAGTLPEFPHRAHIRMAWLYLRREGLERGRDQIRSGIQQMAQLHDAPGKYHETITLFWIYLVHYALTLTPEIDDFEAFIEQHTHLLDAGLLKIHYSPAILTASRQTWAEPDLKPLPGSALERELP